MAIPPATLTRAQLGASKSVPTTRVSELIARDLAHIDVPLDAYYGAVGTTTNDTTGESLADFELYCPGWAAAAYFYGIVEGYVSSGTGQWRLVNSTDSNNGDWVDITTTGGYAEQGEAKVLIDSLGVKTIQIWGKAPASQTLELRSQLGLVWWFETS